MRLPDPGCYRLSSLPGDFELHWPVRLVLHDHGAWQDCLTLGDIKNAQGYQITATQLAIYSELNHAKLRTFASIWSLIRMARISLSFNGAFWPRSLPLFQGADALGISIWEFMRVSFNEKPPIVVRQTDAHDPKQWDGLLLPLRARKCQTGVSTLPV
jgi:hypothetical protein